MLALRPAIGAIAAGNAVLIKPRMQLQAAEALLENHDQPPVENALDTGGEGSWSGRKCPADGTQFDFVFFTGGTEIGRKVYQAATGT